MAILITYAPQEGSTNTALSVEATNNDTGATYNSADLNVTKLLAYNPTPEIDSLWELPANSDNYNSISDMVSAWNANLRDPPTGEVYTGWNMNSNGDGSFNIQNNDFDWTAWQNTASNPSKDMQFYSIDIPKEQLSLLGLGSYTASDYATITQSSTTVPDAFIGYEGGAGGLSWSTDGNHYQVAVPEASITGLLIGATALAIAAKRKGKSLVAP